MANTKSAEKRARQTRWRTAHNKSIKTRMKNCRKAVAQAIADGDKTGAAEALKRLASAADRAAKNGVIHKNSASRLKAINATRIAAL